MRRLHQQSSVFKKFEEQNLFQISCSDIVERFKLVLIIGLILLQSNAQDVVYGTVGCLLFLFSHSRASLAVTN